MVMVICKYKDDVSWAPEGSMIYDKMQYGNVGRESEVFCRYIIENYDSIPNAVVFLQGNPFDHCPHLQRRINEYKGGIEMLSDMIVSCDLDSCPHKCGMNMRPYIAKYTPEIKDEIFMFSTGAQYIVERRYILSKPLHFWQRLHQSHWEEPMTPWILERLWPSIWTMTI